MARDGDGIYESDAGFDALRDIKDDVMREVMYWFAPEQVEQDVYWLEQALTVIEMLLILAEDKRGYRFVENGTTIRRWQTMVFSVWDAEWNYRLPDYRDPIPYSEFAYRVEQRMLVNSLFDHLYNLTEETYGEQTLILTKRRPMFRGGDCVWNLCKRLIHRIVFELSDDNDNRNDFFSIHDLHEVWVAVDLLGLLCERYQMSVHLRTETVQHWLDLNIVLWLNEYGREPGEQVSTETLSEDPLYVNVMNAFVRLIMAIQKVNGD